MSVFNDEGFLAEAVDECKVGDRLAENAFIIDDDSTDRTAQNFSDYTQRDARIPIFRHQNRGRADSLNSGILARTGYFVCETAQ